MRLAAILVLCFFTATAHGDIRYRVRPRLGELESFGRGAQVTDCGATTRTKLWTALARQPVVTVRSGGVIDVAFNFKGGLGLKASRQWKVDGKIVGFWESEVKGLMFEVDVTERATKPPLVEVAIHIDMPLPDGTRETCTERWVGLGDKF